MRILLLSTFSGLLFFVSAPQGDKVTVKGVHLCCGSCLSAANDALEDIEGVSGGSSDLNSKIVSFTATDAAAAKRGLEALAKEGFFGTAFLNGKEIDYPESGVKRGATSNTFTLEGIHLCCTSCVTASQKALQDVRGVKVIDIDRNERTIKLTGDNISVYEAVSALNKAGFYVKFPKKSK